VAQPLNRLTAKGVRWQWTQEEQQAFDHLKQRLMEAPILAYPDLAKEYILDTDASDHSVGAVLSQVQGGSKVVVAYYSKTLAAAEKNYCTTRKELLAVVKAVKHFWPYLYGRTFRLRTDHASLIWLCKRVEPSSQVARWLEILAEISHRIKPRAGRKHGNANGMSRRTLEDCRQCLHIEKRDGGPARLDVKTELGEGAVCRWEHGHLRTETHSDDVQALHANPTLYQNVKELCRLQERLPGVVADIFRAKKEGRRPSEEQQWQGDVEFQLLCRRWDILKVSPDGPHITCKGTESSSGTTGCWVRPSGACSFIAVRKNGMWCCCCCKPSDARPGDAGSGTPDIPFPAPE